MCTANEKGVIETPNIVMYNSQRKPQRRGEEVDISDSELLNPVALPLVGVIIIANLNLSIFCLYLSPGHKW